MGVFETVSALSELLNKLSMSAQQAAEKAEEMGINLPYGTLAGYWAGNHGKPKRESLAKLAQVVSLSEERLQKAAWGRSAPLGPYAPPEEAMHLTGKQRKAIDELIKSITTDDEDGLADEGELGAAGAGADTAMFADIDDALGLDINGGDHGRQQGR